MTAPALYVVPDDPPPRVGLAARLVDRSGLSRLPKPSPLVTDTLDRGTVALIAGKHGSGKSFLSIDLALCVATGKGWQGRRADAGRVLYIAAEGALGVSQRVSAWEAAWRTEVPSGRLDVLPCPVNLSRVDEVAELVDLVRAGGYALVVVDTLARCAVGADENSARDMGLIVDAVYRVLEATPSGRGVVALVHHAGKGGAVRGSSALEAGVDTVYRVEKDGADVTVERTKRKDGPEEDRHELRLTPTPGTDSATLGVHHRVDMTQSQTRLMSAYMSSFSATGARKSDLRDAADMPSGSFHRALNQLVEAGSLVNTGTDKVPFYTLPTP